MRRLIGLLAIIGILLVAGCSSSTTAVQTVDPQAFLKTASQPGVTIVDVRTPAEFAESHIDGAINIDVENPTFAAEIESLDKGGTYAVYCRSGRRSTVATDAMAQAGFTTVYNLDGGLADLQAAGGELVAS